MHQLSLLPRPKQHLARGAVHIPDWLSLEQQRQLLSLCREWAKQPAGLYTPKMLDGIPLSVRVVCLGWHWYPYRYSKTRDDCDRLPCKPFPVELQHLASRALEETLAQYEQLFQPDVAIINWYGARAKLGMHQDRTEAEAVRSAGSPIISISLGDTCLFRLGNSDTRSGVHQDIELQSGDLFVFGGAARMAFHGVLKIYSETAPPELGMKQGRLSITIRQTGLSHVFQQKLV
ncbi:alpha-ketoglutarate-dependent dioxygenase AlkB [Chroococcidiopsis sp. CCMEE 29]|uniref:alpha-ketoglutarate-dependent dioxygenase AlkB n=1 Tax=Chroococcidiopsis sp. CCMEE 29 TaxID=155894 RepID=UPI002021DA4C|nr:alpha-ketoglutarate-dependent dioxygenase AlkB [Chroococcidiopsis sp. CCMEE 29]